MMQREYNFCFDHSIRIPLYNKEKELPLKDCVMLCNLYNGILEFDDVIINNRIIKKPIIVFDYFIYCDDFRNYIKLKEYEK